MPLTNPSSGRPKPHFFYCTGTAYVVNIFQSGLFAQDRIFGYAGNLDPVKGLNGQIGYFVGGVQNDPFPAMLDPSKWVSQKVDYQDAFWPMQASVDSGVRAVVDKISKLPKGTPFGLGGYSQGAAVMSTVLRYHLQQSAPSIGSNAPYPVLFPYPEISDRLGDLKAAVMFGNPCRQASRLWGPWKTRAPIYNPTTENPDAVYDPSNTAGGHGIFPQNWRITNTPSFWWEFNGGNVASRKNSPLGEWYTQLTGKTSVLAVPDAVTGIGGVDGDSSIGGQVCAATNAVFNQPFSVLGIAFALLNTTQRDAFLKSMGLLDAALGHTAYPKFAPPGYESPDDPTSYQLALEYLDYVGSQNQLAPSVIPRGISGGRGPSFNQGTIRGGRGVPAFRPIVKPAGTPSTVAVRGPVSTPPAPGVPVTVVKKPPVTTRGFRPNGTTGGLPGSIG